MERKFSMSLIAKELKRFVWLFVVLCVLLLVGIVVYSFGVYQPTYTIDAGEHVYFQQAKPESADGQAAVNAAELASIYRRINGQGLKDVLNETIKGYIPGIKNPESVYELRFEDNVYKIKVTMTDKKQATAVAQSYIDYVKSQISSGDYNTDSKIYTSDTDTSPILGKETGLTPLKLSVFGVVGIVAVYVVVALMVFYFNRKLYNAEEFADNFAVNVLESDVKKNGYHKTAVKLSVQLKNNEETKLVALCGRFDIDVFGSLLEAEGYSVLKTNVTAVLSATRELLEENGIDVLSGEQERLKNIETCRNEIKKNYQYDYVLISAQLGDDLIAAADVADGTVLAFDLQKDTYKAIKNVFQELSVSKEAKLLGVVL